MKYISVSPDNSYFHWQVEVYLTNFLEMKVNPSDIHVVWISNNPSSELIQLQAKYIVRGVQFFTYPFPTDEQQLKYLRYIPNIQIWGLTYHSSVLKTDKYFLHDADIILLQNIDHLDQLCSCAFYCSDTISYIGSQYILSKSEHLFNAMCQVVGIQPAIVKAFEDRSGGAQYILNDLSSDFWRKVMKDAFNLYTLMSNHESSKQSNGIQIWTAGMWSILWNLFLSKKPVKVIPELDFTFATSSIDQIKKVSILHNAGVTSQNKDLFYKGAFINKSPFNEDLSYVNPQYCSYRYVQAIQSVVMN